MNKNCCHFPQSPVPPGLFAEEKELLILGIRSLIIRIFKIITIVLKTKTNIRIKYQIIYRLTEFNIFLVGHVSFADVKFPNDVLNIVLLCLFWLGLQILVMYHIIYCIALLDVKRQRSTDLIGFFHKKKNWHRRPKHFDGPTSLENVSA